MNIMHCICSLNTGGAEKLLIDLVSNIKCENEDSINVCITNNQYDENLLNQLASKAKVYKLERPESSKSIKYIIDFIKLVKKQNINIIHCHNRGSYKFAIIAKVILGKKIKIVYTIHDTNIYNNISLYYKYIDKLLVNKFIAISKSTENDLLSMNVKIDKIERIYNGIDFNNFKNDKNLKTRNNEGNIVVGCVARLVPTKKGQDVLINAISIVKEKYPNIVCRFAGDVLTINGKKDMQILKELSDRVTKLSLEENIEFLGNVSNVPQFMNGIDIFVLPSRVEGFGLTIVEAMASKIPVIASNIDGPREIINERYGILFEKENYKELAEKIIELIENNNLINTDEVYNYAKSNYDITYMANRYYNLYKKVI